MLKINKTQFNTLKKYEQHLTRGFKGNYVTGLTSKEFNAMYDIYQAAGGEAKLEYGCTTCTLQLLKALGKVYFKMKETKED